MAAEETAKWLVIGLGNPGAQYAKTRHNLGFMVVDLLAERGGKSIRRDECRSLVGQIELGGGRVELVKPQTFMNLSGEAVGCLLKKPARNVKKLIVISDDLALPVGKIRLRPKGSSGGHNGLKSIAAVIRTDEFIRLRIGIQPEHPVSNTRNFVLEEFSKTERGTIENAVREGADAVEKIIADGIEAAMAKFN